MPNSDLYVGVPDRGRLEDDNYIIISKSAMVAVTPLLFSTPQIKLRYTIRDLYVCISMIYTFPANLLAILFFCS